jgi:hypothetical protein
VNPLLCAGLPKAHVAHGLIGNTIAEMIQSTGDAIVSPATIRTSHAEDEFGDLACDGGSARIETVPGSIKLLSDKLTEPRQDGVRPGDRGHKLESSTAESFAEDGKSGPLRISQQKTGR